MSTSPFPWDDNKAAECNEDEFAIDLLRPPTPAPVELRLPSDLVEFSAPHTGLGHVGNKPRVVAFQTNRPAPTASPPLYSSFHTLTVCAKTSPQAIRRREDVSVPTDVVYLTTATAEDETGQVAGVPFYRRTQQRCVGSKHVSTQPPLTGSYVELRSLDAASFLAVVTTRGGRAKGRYRQYYVHMKEGGRYSLQLFTADQGARITRLYTWTYVKGERWQQDELLFHPIVPTVPTAPLVPAGPVAPFTPTLPLVPYKSVVRYVPDLPLSPRVPLRPFTPDPVGDTLSQNGSSDSDQEDGIEEPRALSRLQDDAANIPFNAENTVWWPCWGSGLTVKNDDWKEWEERGMEDDTVDGGEMFTFGELD